jgi:hypothetical protein
MTREEFITQIRQGLTGKVPATTVEDQVNYYTEYIITKVRMGESEEAVIGTLGNPRLLCRTIVEANRHAECDSYARSEDASYVEVEEEKFSLASFGTKLLRWYMNLPAVVHKVVRTAMMILGLFLAFQVAKVVFPVLLFIWLIWIVFSLFRNLGN